MLGMIAEIKGLAKQAIDVIDAKSFHPTNKRVANSIELATLSVQIRCTVT
jgi:hypothetical protein